MKILRPLLFIEGVLLLLASCSRPTINGENDQNYELETTNPYDAYNDNGETFQQISHVPTYSVELNIEPLERHFSGVLQVDFLNASRFNLDRVYFTAPQSLGITAAIIDSIHLNFSHTDSRLRLYLQRPLPPAGLVDISLVFEGHVPIVGQAFGGNDHALWFGGFLPSLAVIVDDEWQLDLNFALTSNFLVNITTPADFTLAATADVTATHGADFNHFSADAIMSRDFAFAVLSPSYDVLRATTPEGVAVSLHYNIHFEHDIAVLEDMLNTAQAALSHFHNLIAPKPHNSLQIVEISLTTGFEAHSGIVFLDLRQLRHIDTRIAIAQGIAAQWLYNVVGAKSEMPWLTRGLADFLALDFILPRNQMSHHVRNLDTEQYPHTRYIVLYYALREEMGSQNFEEFVRAYYGHYAFDIATTEGLVALAYDFGVDLTFFESWLFAEELPALPELPSRNEEEL